MKTLPLALVVSAALMLCSGALAESLLTYPKAQTATALGEFAVLPSVDLVSQAPARLQVQSPSGELLSFEREYLERRASGGTTWIGASRGGEQIVLTVEQGHITGVIDGPNGAYHLLPTADGYRLRTPLFKTGVETDCGTEPSQLPAAHSPNMAEGNGPASGDVNAPTKDSAGQIDVLVVYSAATRQAQGGASAMVSLAQSVLDLNNMAFRKSQMAARFRLVGVRQVAFNGTSSLGNALNWMLNNGQLRNLRNSLRADMVGMLMTHGTDACGIAATIPRGNIQSYSEVMFQVTKIACTSNHTFSHEMGHLLGMEHDPANGRPVAFASYPWSYGHFVSGRFRTVMSYRAECTATCNRIPYYSSPSLNYQGVATGIAGQRDNRRTGNLIAPITANYRRADAGSPPDAPTELTAAEPLAFRVDLRWSDASDDETAFEIERASVDGEFSQIASLPADTTTFSDDTAEPLTEYRYRVRAVNSFGMSEYTNVVQLSTPTPNVSACQAGETVTCLLGDRFELKVAWRDASGNTGDGRAVDVDSDQSALFWFFGPNNWEMLVKVIDGCGLGGHYWVFSAATTDVEIVLDVRDTTTGRIRTYINELGVSAPAVTDTNAFAECP